MKRLRLSAVLMLVIAIVAFVPMAAQNAPTTAKRAIALEDILAFRAMGVTSLSPNGQWFAYRLSPLQGDSEVVVRATSRRAGMKFPVGEGGGGARRSRPTRRGPAITISPTRSEAQANTRARRPNQNSVTLVNLANGEKTTIAKIRRFAFAGEAGGWVAMHRYGADAGGRRGARRPRRRPAGGRGGGAAARRRDAPRDTRAARHAT